MTRFGITALLAAFVLIMVAVLKIDGDKDPVIRYILLLLAGVLIGAFIAVEAQEHHMVNIRRNGKEHKEDE